MNVVRILRLSILTSLMSKGAGFLFQLAAIPLALSALGTDKFALFMLYTGLTTWVGLCATGIAPSLTAKIANGVTDRIALQYLFNAVIFITGMICCVGLPVYLLSLLLMDSVFQGIAYAELVWVYLFVGVLLISGVIDSVNAGRNQMHVTNFWFSVGSLLNLCLMYIAVQYLQTDSAFELFVVSQSGLIFARLVNTAIVLKQLKIGFACLQLNKKMINELKANFGSFFMIQLSVVFAQQAIVLFTYSQSKELSAALSVIYRVYALMGSVLTMVSQPLWPMIIRARSVGNTAMLALWHRRLLAYNLAASAVLGMVIYLYRAQVNQHWLNGQLHLTDLQYGIFLANYLLIAFGQVNVTFLLGFEQFSIIGKMLSVEALTLIVLFTGLVAVSALSVQHVILVSASAFLLTSCWLGIYFVNKQLKASI